MATTKKFSIGEPLRFGLRTLKEHLGFFIFVSLLVGFVARIPELVGSFVKDFNFLFLLEGVDFVLGAILAVGLLRVTLKFSRREKGAMTDFLPASPLVFRFLSALLVYSFGAYILVFVPFMGFIFIRPFFGSPHPTFSGSILLGAMAVVMVVLPIWGGTRFIEWQFFGEAMLDEGLGIRDAFRRSASIARKARWDLFAFDLLFLSIGVVVAILQYALAIGRTGGAVSCAVESVLGEFVLLVGWLASWPFLVAHAFMYRKLVNGFEASTSYAPLLAILILVGAIAPFLVFVRSWSSLVILFLGGGIGVLLTREVRRMERDVSISRATRNVRLAILYAIGIVGLAFVLFYVLPDVYAVYFVLMERLASGMKPC